MRDKEKKKSKSIFFFFFCLVAPAALEIIEQESPDLIKHLFLPKRKRSNYSWLVHRSRVLRVQKL